MSTESEGKMKVSKVGSGRVGVGVGVGMVDGGWW